MLSDAIITHANLYLNAAHKQAELLVAFYNENNVPEKAVYEICSEVTITERVDPEGAPADERTVKRVEIIKDVTMKILKVTVTE